MKLRGTRWKAAISRASPVINWLNELIERAENLVENYDGDDRQDIKTDVLNAFYAGAAFVAQSGRRVEWQTTDRPLPSGWYWWRFDATYDKPEMVYSNGASNICLSLVDMDYCADEYGDWSGEWWGPIEPPAAVITTYDAELMRVVDKL